MAKKNIWENKIMTMRGLPVSIIFCLVAFMLSGCAASQPTRFFVLNTLENPEKPSAQSCRNGRTFTLGVNPVTMPRYLDRPQIMTRVSDNEYRLSELNVWAEPLKDMLTRVIAQNLNTMPCADVVTLPKAGSKQIDYRLSIEVIRLDGTLGGQALLEVRWSIIEEQTHRVLITKDTRYGEPVSSHDYHALAYAYNRVLDAFSLEISGSLASITQSASHQE
jgi:uncharacterized protein